MSEYRRVGQWIIDNIWENGYEKFQPSKDKLELPKYLDYTKFKLETSLSARALSSLVSQLVGVLSAASEKRRKCLWVIEKLKLEGKPFKKLEKKTHRNYKLVKPNFGFAKAELSSKCADIIKVEGEFNFFLELKSLGKEFGKIRIPIKDNKVSEKWAAKGEMLGSFLISEKSVNLRFRIEKKNLELGAKVVGIDQGMKDVATLSDGQVTPNIDNHGHSLESIMQKLSRCEKGSKAFGRAQEQRKNFINWSLNQVDMSDFKEIRLEKIWNIGFKTRKSRLMSHWTNTLIRDKIKSLAEEAEVPLIEQDSSYRSQRCSNCGIVRKANRKKKIYECKHCGNCCDADFNASLNHSIDLPEIHWSLRGQKFNLGNGFYWLTQGLFTFDGRELESPIPNQE